MRRIPALILLVILSIACAAPARAQIFMGKDSAQRAQKAAKKQQKARNKAIKKYQKAQRKAAKKSRRHAKHV